MKKNLVNTEVLEGRIYDFDIEKKTVQNTASKHYGEEFWQGTLQIATDEEGLNVIPVHYSFVTKQFASGKPDSRFTAFEKIKSENKTWMATSKEEAMKVKVTPSAALNDFYVQNTDQMVAQQRNEGGFVNFINTLSPVESRNKFTFDFLINNVKMIEPKEDSDDQPYAEIRGLIFDFRGAVLPFTVVARSEGAINYFMDLDASPKNLIFTQVWGQVRSTTVTIKKETESAFGEPTIDYVEKTRREWLVTGARPVPYGFGDPENITAEELTEKLAERNIYLETVKSKALEYYANKQQPSATPPAGVIPNIKKSNTDFDFGFGY